MLVDQGQLRDKVSKARENVLSAGSNNDLAIQLFEEKAEHVDFFKMQVVGSNGLREIGSVLDRELLAKGASNRASSADSRNERARAAGDTGSGDFVRGFSLGGLFSASSFVSIISLRAGLQGFFWNFVEIYAGIFHVFGEGVKVNNDVFGIVGHCRVGSYF